MTFEPVTVLSVAALYLLLFFAVAWLTDRKLLPSRLLRHPALYVLSLGVIVSTWSFYTAFLSAASRGYGYNAYYIGFAGAFLLAPLLLQPLLRITRRFQLASLADLFAFRFRSPWAGTLTTLVLLICVFPLLALQTLAVAGSTRILSPETNPDLVAFGYCVVMIAFTLRFGTRDIAGRERNNSLVASLAFEAIVKLVALLTAGVFAVFEVMGGIDALQQWLELQPADLTKRDISFMQDTTNLLVLLFFTAAISMPHIFHLTFQENRNPQDLRIASWGVPLYLLLASLPVLPLFWAYLSQGLEGNMQYAPLVLGQATSSPIVTLLYYMGGMAAACGMVIVLALSISSMCMNHLLLRTTKPPVGTRLYSWLLLQRRVLIVGIMLGGYLCYLVIAEGRWVGDMGYISFIACMQFLPGILGLLYWPPANSKGFITGVLGGLCVWALLGVLPFMDLATDLAIFNIGSGAIDWNQVASASLLTNLCLLLGVSLLTRTSDEERKAASLCALDSRFSTRYVLQATSVNDFVLGLAPQLGPETARREVMQAVQDLGLKENETRPYQLLQLRSQIEANLSSLLGPTIGHRLIEHHLPVVPSSGAQGSALNLLEQGVESWQGNLSGVALDLDLLRRHHRQVLQDLPMGVCELDEKGQIALWNTAMTTLTGLAGDTLIGQRLTALPKPWRDLLRDFARDSKTTGMPRTTVSINGKQRWLSLHKSTLARSVLSSAKTSRGPDASNDGFDTGQIILVEDQTETTRLEQELAHSDRLSSIGRLAAGVAHEIGNPVTGIACLAQNLRDETPEPVLREMAEQIVTQTRRISSIMDALLRFSHGGGTTDKPVAREPVELHRVTSEAFKLITLQQDAVPITFLNECEPGLCIEADYQQMLQILLNLLGNARDASQPGARIVVTHTRRGGLVDLEVLDQGSGIPPELLPQVFEPFFTTKDPGKGTGLGLALVYRLVSNLGGQIRIQSPAYPDRASEGKGTRVIVTFPCYDPGTLVTK